MKAFSRLALLAAAVAPLIVLAGGARAQLILSGNDEKQNWDASGKQVNSPPGKDTVSIIDISNRTKPRIIANLPLMNTVVGPPTNLAITPDQKLALVANSLDWVKDGESWKGAPDNKLYIIDLTASPPKHIDTVELGKQPSGMAINPKGDLALVANRADGTISVLSIRGRDVVVLDTVTVGTGADQVSAVAITPDGKRALAVKSSANKVALLSIDGQKVTYDKSDLPAGIFPHNIAVTPDGKLALTSNTGSGGSSDGSADTVSVIDLETSPPRVIDHVTVGDAPEGLAISPKGDLAVSIEARGSNAPTSAFYYRPAGAATALKIDGKKVNNVGEIRVGALPQGVAFGPDGNYVYVANFIDQDLWVLRVDGTKLTDTVQRVKLSCHPGSMRSGPQ